MSRLRLNRILSSQGFGSRKDCGKIIKRAGVTINGEEHRRPDAKIEADGLVFTVFDEEVRYRARVVVALHKPLGVECSGRPQHHPPVMDLLPPRLINRTVQPVGRLDVETSGLLLLTDDGALLHKLTHPKSGVQKRYRATLVHAAGPELGQALLDGVVLRDDPEPVAALAVEQPEPTIVELVLTRGRYHQVRRMVGAAHNRVRALERLSIGSVGLEGIEETESLRLLEEDEIARLFDAVVPVPEPS